MPSETRPIAVPDLAAPVSERVAFLERVARDLGTALQRRLRRLGLGADDAADVMQDALTQLCAYERWNEIGSAEAFLWRSARNLVIDRARAAPPRQAQALDDEHPSDAPSAEQLLAAQQELALLRAALTELPENCQAVFVRHRFDGKSHRAIADEFGISVSMVEKHIMRAMLHLRRRLADVRQPQEDPQR